MIFLRFIAQREHITNEGGYDAVGAVQSMKGVTKNTGVVDIEVNQGYVSEIDNYNT